MIHILKKTHNKITTNVSMYEASEPLECISSREKGGTATVFNQSVIQKLVRNFTGAFGGMSSGRFTSSNRSSSSNCKKKILSLLVAGDFKFPDISWTQNGGFCTNKVRPSSLEFLNILGKNFLTQHVLEPTFKSNILDLVITNDPSRVFRVSHGPPLVSTVKDCLHTTVSWCYELRSQPLAHTDSTPRQILSLGNYELFSERIQDSAMLLENDVNTAYNQLVKSYCETSSIANPTRLHHARLHHSPKWFNANIKKLTKSKYKLHCQI
ncbi:RNA-directed DNA polymerase from mobile element jockey-like, partial [Brachionus plicatilis]